jgi:hypothetical protein
LRTYERRDGDARAEEAGYRPKLRALLCCVSPRDAMNHLLSKIRHDSRRAQTSSPTLSEGLRMDERKQAETGLKQIQEAIIALLRQRPDGLRNADIAEALNLRSDFRGRQKDYLTYSVLGGLMHQGRVARNEKTKRFIVK